MDIFEIWYQKIKGKSFKSLLTRALWIKHLTGATTVKSFSSELLYWNKTDIKLFHPSGRILRLLVRLQL